MQPELVNAGAKEGTDFGGCLPGTTGSYVAVVDTFVAGRARPTRQRLDFLKVIGTAQTETSFSKIRAQFAPSGRTSRSPC